jgi:hypothetical protein
VPLEVAAWQVAQPVVMPVWLITPGLSVAPVWHSVQAWVVGMWLAGMLPPDVPEENEAFEVWQLEQSPVVGCAGSCAGVGRVTIITPTKLFPVSWQVAHPLVMPVWFIVNTV